MLPLKSALDTFHKTLYVIGTGWPAEFVASYEFEIDFLKIAPLLKHPKFVEEQEWRLISQPIALDNPRVNFREGKSMVVPFFEIELAETYENLTVSKICIGPTHHPNLSENAIYSLLTAKGVHNCFVEVSKVFYRLIFHRTSM